MSHLKINIGNVDNGDDDDNYDYADLEQHAERILLQRISFY